MAAVDTSVPTSDRLRAVALEFFANRGYEASSLDDIARAGGVAKQTLLYHFSSKEILLRAVIEAAVGELAETIRRAATAASRRRRAVVDAMFRVGTQRPELLELIREALRLGPPASEWLRTAAEPLLDEIPVDIERDEVLGAVAMIIGMATEADVLESLGVAPTLAQLRRRRRALLEYLGD